MRAPARIPEGPRPSLDPAPRRGPGNGRGPRLRVALPDAEQARRALADAEEQFRLAFHQAPFGMSMVAPDGRWLRVNHAYADMLGYTEDELDSRSFRDLTHPDDVDADLRYMREALRGGPGVLDREKRYLHRGGGVVWTYLRTSLVRDERGVPLYFISQLQDITDRKRSQERLQQVEERYRRLVEKLPAITYIAEPGPEGRWLFVSPQVESMLGFSPEQWRADPSLWASRLHSADRDRVLAEEGQHATAGEAAAVEYRMLARDGRVLWVRDEAVPGRQRIGDHEAVVFEGLITEVTERKRLEEQLRHHADRDALTGLLNRRRFEEELRRHVAEGGHGAVLLVDIDHFKLVNDSYGHACGDDVLRTAARCLGERLRETDVLARLGGDEFAAILGDATAPEALTAVRDVLRQVRAGSGEASVTASAGVALFEQAGALSADDVLVRADLALYEAKEGGRDQVSLFDGQRHASLAWLDRLRRAIADDRLVLHSQPVVELATGRTVHEELLVRLIDEAGELVAPGAFLLIAERFGLIRDIDRWVVSQAVIRAAEGRRVAVNISAQSIGDEELTTRLERELAATGTDPSRILFEITETSAMANLADARRFVERLGRIGVSVALDDFGTGFSSFAYLKHLPVQWLKIDMEFIRELASSPADQRIVKAIATIAGGFGMRTVAEGVEDADTLALLESYDIDCAQGYHIARPSPCPQKLEALP